MSHPAEAPHAATDVVATTEADGTHGHGPELLGLNAEGWVYVGLTIFILLAIFVAKAPKKITDALDARIAETVRELDQAKALRAEAERLLADAQARQAASANDAAAILAHAEAEARDVISDAEQEAEQLIARRSRMAEDKIGAAERSAIADIRARAAKAATSAAEALIRARHDGEADKALVDETITALGRPN